MQSAVFEIKQNAVGRYYFVFQSEDNQRLVVTQSFSKRSLLEQCISEIRETAAVAELCDSGQSADPPLFQMNQTADGWTCSLLGFSGNLIFISEKYRTKEECIAAVKIIKKLAADAGIIDSTK